MNRLKGILLIICAFSMYGKEPRLLIKIPSRSRPVQLIKCLTKFTSSLSGKVPCHFLVSCDEDDKAVHHPKILDQIKKFENLTLVFGKSKTKVEAYNRDIDAIIDNYDIVLVASDDMEPVVAGYDEIIVKEMQQRFPDYDGVLHFNDGVVGAGCNTMPVIGVPYYKRFGYIYHPSYQSLSCDVELSTVARLMGKEALIGKTIIRHKHPAWTGVPYDALYTRNESYKSVDRQKYISRREACFDMPQKWIQQPTKEWSILICTITEREAFFNRIYNKLQAQIAALGLQDKIEVLFFKDNRGEHSIGHKRNVLMQQSTGEYICFVDDDDDVHPEYIKMIHEKLQNSPDCVSLVGILAHSNRAHEKFIHSIKYAGYFKIDSMYYRPPNHLNPIKRSIAILFAFPSTNMGEDTDWAMQIAHSGLLKSEAEITEPYYFYIK